MLRSLASIASRPPAQFATALLIAVAWVALLGNQFPTDNRVARCWFYAPELEELSPSELLSALCWLGASAVCAYRAYTGPRVWGVLAAVCFFCVLEESNYGVPYVTAMLGDYATGSSLHNQLESADQRAFWLVESALKLAFFLVLYPAVAFLAYRRTGSLLRTVPYALPGFLFLLTSLRTVSWHLLNHPGSWVDALIQEVNVHPCLWVEEELQELILAAAVFGWCALGLPSSHEQRGVRPEDAVDGEER